MYKMVKLITTAGLICFILKLQVQAQSSCAGGCMTINVTAYAVQVMILPSLLFECTCNNRTHIVQLSQNCIQLSVA